MLYFDHNATTPLLPAAREAWLEAAERFPANPSSPHRAGARADAALEAARARLAELLDCDAGDIVWTSGATESNNTVLNHFTRALPAGGEVWVSAIEHPCVLEPAISLLGGRLRRIPVSKAGVVEVDWIERELARARPALVAVMAANNETGALQPWQDILSLCRAKAIPFLCDAAQWIGKLPARGLGECDFVTGSAHKFGGPKGVGFLKCLRGARLHPLLLGGPQEDRRRAGTENVPGVAAMLAALEAREGLLASDSPQLRLAWRMAFEKSLRAKLPGVEIVASGANRLWNTVSVLMPALDCPARWVVRLDRLGCAVSTGSACASGKEQPSHVLAAMGLAPGQSDRVLRFSSGWETTEADWDRLLDTLVEAPAGLRAPARTRKSTRK